MSVVIDRSAALVALPRPRVSVLRAADAVRLHDDAQPRLLSALAAPAAMAWRPTAGATMRGFEAATTQGTQDGRSAAIGAAYVTTTTFVKQHSTRSGPPTSRPPA